MAQKKKTHSPASHLIESLIEDVKTFQDLSDSLEDDNHGGFDSLSQKFEDTIPPLSSNVADMVNSHQATKNSSSDALANGQFNIFENLVAESQSGSESGPIESPVGLTNIITTESINLNDNQWPHSNNEPRVINVSENQLDLKISGTDQIYEKPAIDKQKGISLDEKTLSIPNSDQKSLSPNLELDSSNIGDEKTLAVEGFANAKVNLNRKNIEAEVKVSIGQFRGGNKLLGSNVLTSMDASLVQAESLKIAQNRILELENEVEKLRYENEELASAGDVIKNRADALSSQIRSLDKEKKELHESAQNEIIVLKGSLQYRETEASKFQTKIEELESRLKSDFKKIRVRERELENRLELLRAEKAALVRSKDEYILDQKRKIDHLSQELDNYREKCLELNKALEVNQDQFKRTERALRLALSNLEVKEESFTPIKKAE